MSDERGVTREGGPGLTFFSSTHLLCELDALVVPEASRSQSQPTFRPVHLPVKRQNTLDSLAQISDDGDTLPLPELVQLVGRLLQSARGSRRDVDFGAVLDVARGDLSALYSGIISSRSGMMTREQI